VPYSCTKKEYSSPTLRSRRELSHAPESYGFPGIAGFRVLDARLLMVGSFVRPSCSAVRSRPRSRSYRIPVPEVMSINSEIQCPTIM
jgi:hypothetical protein